MKKIFTLFAFIAIVLSSSAQEMQVKDLSLTGMVKTQFSRMGRGYTSLEDATGNSLQIYNESASWAYGEYTVTAYLAADDITVSGTGTWNLVNEVETLVATLTDDEQTVTYNITATVSAIKNYTLTCNDAQYFKPASAEATTFVGQVEGVTLKITIDNMKTGNNAEVYGVYGETDILAESVAVMGNTSKYMLSGTFDDAIGNTYKVSMKATPMAKTPIEVTNASYAEENGNIVITGLWNDSDLTVTLNTSSTTDNLVYEEATLVVGDIQATSAAATFTQTADGFTLTGEFIQADETAIYTLSISGTYSTIPVVIASDIASYLSEEEEVLTVTGLSAEKVGYIGSLVLQVYGWDGGGKSSGYAAILTLEGEEVAFCDNGLMITLDATGVMTITGKMLGYPYDYRLNAQVSPKQAKTIQVVSDNMEVTKDIADPKDLKLNASLKGYTIEILLYRAVSNPYKTYAHKTFQASVNGTNVVLADTVAGSATFSQEGDLAKFEASLIYNMDTLALTLTGLPYAAPEDIVPVDTVDLNFVNATVVYKMSMNRINATSEVPEAELFIGYGIANYKAMIGTHTAADFSYDTELILEGQKITFLRGEMTVKQDGDNKLMTAGLLGNNRVWYNIQLTTAAELPTEDHVIILTFDKFYADPSYTPEETITDKQGNNITVGGDWLISLKNDDAQFTFDYYGGTPDTFTGSFTIDNIDTDFSYGYYQGTRVNYKTCNLTITETHPTATITRYVLEADITSEEDVHYLVHATHDVLTATETVTAEILDAEITLTDYGFLLTAKHDEQNLDIQLAIQWSFGVEGYFSSKVVDTVNTNITHKGNTFDPMEMEMEIVFEKELTTGNPGYSIPSLRFMSPDTLEYNLKIEAPIMVNDTVGITCTNLTWDESQKAEDAIMFEASDEAYSVFGMLNDSSINIGTYDSEKATVELTHTATGKSITALITTIVIAGNPLQADFTVEVELLGDDSNMYLIHLSKTNTTTALDNITYGENTTIKVIKNGQLIIIRNGEKFNAQGVRL